MPRTTNEIRTIEGQQLGTETKINRAAYKRSAQILLRGYVPVYRASAALKQAFSEIASGSGALSMKA